MALGVALVATTPARSADSTTSEDALGTVAVVGTAIHSADEDLLGGVRPIQVITIDDLTAGSGDHVGDFLHKLPINNGYMESPMTDEYGGGDSYMNLRGIGSQYTLALIDGRRFNGESLPADVGVLPTGAIQSMEVLTGGASAIYGSDAVAGVLNIQLRRHFQGVEFHSSYGESSRHDAGTARYGVVFGTMDEKFSFTGSLEYQDRNGFNRPDRELTATRDFRPYGGIDRRSATVGEPQIIRLTSDGGATPLTIDVSRFSAGYYSGDLSDYVPYDKETQAFTTSEWGIYPPQTQTAGHWYSDYKLLDNRVVLFTEGYANRRQQLFNSTYDRPTLTVPASNPYNPFGETVRVTYLIEELPRMLYKLDTMAYQAAAGVQGVLGDYHYEVSFSAHRRRRNTTQQDDIDYDALQAAVNRTDALAFNPFGYYANSAEQLALITPAEPWTAQDIQKNAIATAKVDGKLFDWYAGTTTFALGYERRDLGYSFDPGFGARTINYWFEGSGATPATRNRNVDAVSGELRLPLLAASDRESVFHSAELTAAIRNEKYNDFGSSTVWQSAGKLGLLDDSIILRASYAKSFLAPSLRDLTRTTSTYTNSNAYFDPYFGSVVTVTVTSGGNPNLRPEKGASTNFGVVYRPQPLPNAAFTLDFWELKLTDLIATPSIQALLFGTSLSGSLTRDSVTQLPLVDIRVANGGDRTVHGFDMGAQYHLPTDYGKFDFALNGSYLTRFEDVGNDGSKVNFLGVFSDELAAMPKLRATLSTDWNYRGVSANVILHYMSGYADVIPGVLSRRVGSYNTVDTQVGYAFPQSTGILANARLYGGLENALDTKLPFVAASYEGWDRSLSDLRGRYFYLGMSKKL